MHISYAIFPPFHSELCPTAQILKTNNHSGLKARTQEDIERVYVSLLSWLSFLDRRGILRLLWVAHSNLFLAFSQKSSLDEHPSP